eukprot:TRINITY_DN3629_c0_g2_i1.p1 TRINITY_DN3629_c0_g2~~TRINITY_DN3629_c0_g2_i1.p1  ORF type:complete len:423 (+),score=58.24 TRINITY_DN3629_c0_g2_i1:60-1271(+)
MLYVVWGLVFGRALSVRGGEDSANLPAWTQDIEGWYEKCKELKQLAEQPVPFGNPCVGKAQSFGISRSPLEISALCKMLKDVECGSSLGQKRKHDGSFIAPPARPAASESKEPQGGAAWVTSGSSSMPPSRTENTSSQVIRSVTAGTTALKSCQDEVAALKSEIARLQQELKGNFESKRSIEAIQQDLAHAKQIRDESAVQIKEWSKELNIKKESIDQTLGIVKIRQKESDLEAEFGGKIKAAKDRVYQIASTIRDLMYEAAMKAPDQPSLSLDNFFKSLEDYVLASTTWRATFHASYDPCKPEVFKKAERQDFDNKLPVLLTEFLEHPDVFEQDAFEFYIRAALAQNPKALALFHKLGYPMGEVQSKAFDRLISTKQSRIFGPGSNWTPRHGAMMIKLESCS